jgi:hypothetical protein
MLEIFKFFKPKASITDIFVHNLEYHLLNAFIGLPQLEYSYTFGKKTLIEERKIEARRNDKPTRCMQSLE